MTHSRQNDTVRPTVRFWQIVRGWRDDKGNYHVTTVEVRTNRRSAKRRYNTLMTEPRTRKDVRRASFNFVRLFAVDARTSHVEPELNTTLLDERIY